MKVSDIDYDVVKRFCKEDYNDQDDLIDSIMLPAGIAYISSHTGIEQDALDNYEDLTIALLVIVAEMYDNRRFTVDAANINPLAKSILDLHDNNLLGGADYAN